MSQTVARAIDILELVSARARTQSEVAEVLGVHRSTALRLLETLTASGLVRRGPDARYGVGYRLAGLAALAQDQFELAAVARPHLEGLCQRSGHTIHLAALEGTEIRYADKIEPPRTVRLYSQVGQPVRLHTAGVSKAILAHQDTAVVAQMLAGYDFERFTDTTITSPTAFDDELARVRERGYAVDDGEMESYVTCVAMPLRDWTGEVNASVSITALRARADLDALQTLLPDLEQTAETISKELGWKR